jgi:hypothetical protein
MCPLSCHLPPSCLTLHYCMCSHLFHVCPLPEPLHCVACPSRLARPLLLVRPRLRQPAPRPRPNFHAVGALCLCRRHRGLVYSHGCGYVICRLTPNPLPTYCIHVFNNTSQTGRFARKL